MSSLSNYNTFNISPGKQAYLCSINDFWASRLKFLARTNYLPFHHFLFECKTLSCIRQELFEEIETVINSFYPDLTFSELPPFQKLQFLIGDFCLSFNTDLDFLPDQFSTKLLCKMIKERDILIESSGTHLYCVSLILNVIFIFYL